MFFSESEKQQITEAIQKAEKKTSGEIKVHVEEHCPYDDPIIRAQEVFSFLSLDHTVYRNGVLFYLSITDRKFAILGDEGIHQKAGGTLWEEERNILYNNLHIGHTVDGLCLAIEKAGEALQEHFPYEMKGDLNEISNEISFGKKKK
ncbi:TPM domain-containing protein [Jiulongibacter sp. NS-SX5]|uniref:TPM domain-containing protein n=1 Tax=Jiulongibacter sp. NS-SX5 TaxID=3463854 RepID=UPI004058319A